MGAYYTIQPSDVGTARLECFGRVWHFGNPLGVTQGQDIGKRVHLRDGVLQVESAEQFAARVAVQQAQRDPKPGAWLVALPSRYRV